MDHVAQVLMGPAVFLEVMVAQAPKVALAGKAVLAVMVAP
jgi:hypothetical protein